MIQIPIDIYPLAEIGGSPIGLILFVVIPLFALGLFYIGYLQQKKRSESLAKLASELGMDFSPKPQKSDGFGFSGMPLFSRGRSRRIRNLMSGPMADANGYLFDYQFTTGGGKNSSTYSQTVAVFNIPDQYLPEFSCKPERFFHRLADLFGQEDINFGDYPNFSKNYRLTGSNEEAVRSIFNSNVIEMLETRVDNPWSVDAGGNWIAIYRPSKRIPPEQWSEFLLETTTLLNAMTL
ncbi:MAG: hypothetical protein AAF546_08345 [Verrucomicrobiota bacterium]